MTREQRVAFGHAVEILAEVQEERRRQILRWGPNRDLPGGRMSWHRWGEELEQTAQVERQLRGDSWASILLEEVGEAIQAGNVGALRGELVQVAAVCVAWAAALDRRLEAGDGDGAELGECQEPCNRQAVVAQQAVYCAREAGHNGPHEGPLSADDPRARLRWGTP